MRPTSVAHEQCEDAKDRMLERLLTVTYLGGLLMSIVTFVAFLVVWLHWAQILENCEESAVYCGCVLYGSETFNYFTGGPNIRCHFAVFASIPVIVLTAVLAGFHGYQAFIRPSRKSEHDKHSAARLRGSGPNPPRARASHSERGCLCWPPLAALAALLCALLFAQAVVLTDGRARTCHEYRKHAVKVAMATGQVAEVVYERLPCDAILDMMDYLEPFSRPFRPFKDSDARHPYAEQLPRTRGGMIDTAAALDVSLGCAWAGCALMVLAVILNARLARRQPGVVWCC